MNKQSAGQAEDDEDDEFLPDSEERGGDEDGLSNLSPAVRALMRRCIFYSVLLSKLGD